MRITRPLAMPQSVRLQKQALAESSRRGILTLSPERARIIDLTAARNAVGYTARDLETAHLKAANFATRHPAMSDRQFEQRQAEAARQLEWAQGEHDNAQRRLADLKAESE